MNNIKSLYDFEYKFQELMDNALNNLSSSDFEKIKDSVTIILENYELEM